MNSTTGNIDPCRRVPGCSTFQNKWSSGRGYDDMQLEMSLGLQIWDVSGVQKRNTMKTPATVLIMCTRVDLDLGLNTLATKAT